MVIAVILVLSPPTASPEIAKQMGPAVAGSDAMAQLRYVASHPFGFVNVLANTVGVEGLDLGYWMTGMLGWFTIRVSHVAALALLGLTLILIGGRNDEPPVGSRRRIVLLSTWAATMASQVPRPLHGTHAGRVHHDLRAAGTLPHSNAAPSSSRIYRLKLRRQSVVLLLTAFALAVVISTTLRAVWSHYY